MRFASVVTVASRVESLLGSAVAALEREEREEEFCFQMVDLGESTAHFRFATRMSMVRVQVADYVSCLSLRLDTSNIHCPMHNVPTHSFFLSYQCR